MTAVQKIYFIGCLFLTVSCKHLTPAQRFLNYINDPAHKITQHILIGNMKVIAKWLPPGLQELNLQAADKEREKYKDENYLFFSVQFEKQDHLPDKPDKEKAIYLDFDIEHDFSLLIRNDSLAPVICQKIDKGVSGVYEYLLAFKNQSGHIGDDNFSLVYNDKFFSTGILAFAYNRADIRQIPLLNLSILK